MKTITLTPSNLITRVVKTLMIRTKCAEAKTHRPLGAVYSTTFTALMWRAESDFLFTATAPGTSVSGQPNFSFSRVCSFFSSLYCDLKMPSMWLSENQSKFPSLRVWRLCRMLRGAMLA